MTRKRITVIIAAVALIVTGTVGYATFAVKPHTAQNTGQSTQVTPPVLTKYEVGPPDAQELLELVNKERNIVGVAPLKIDERLNQSAQFKADDMAKRNYFAHTDPDTGKNNGLDYLDSIDDGVCRNISENIVGEDTSSDAVNWWINSPTHYKAMINPDYTLTGYGIHYVDRISLDNITSSKPVYADLVKSYVIVEHFCITR